MIRNLLVIALAMMLSGCLVGDLPNSDDFALGETAPQFSGTYTWPSAVRTDAFGNITALVDPAGDPAFPAAVIQSVPGRGAEPAVGITSANNMFVVVGEEVYRSKDLGKTWEPVHEFVSPNYPTTPDRFQSYDPQLWVDSATDRIFVNHMHPRLACVYVAFSDDEGESWTDDTINARPGYATCGIPVVDHQKLMTAPYGPDAASIPEALREYPNVVYICVNRVVTNGNIRQMSTWCQVSLDGGRSIAYDNQAIPDDGVCPGINGHPAAHPDGTVLLPGGSLNCLRVPVVAVTSDNGVTWTQRRYGGGFAVTEIDPDLTFTPDGTGYLVTAGERFDPAVPDGPREKGVFLFRSTDKFQTWEGPFRVSPTTLTLTSFVGITSGDDGRIAIGYLGTTDLQDDPANATSSIAIEGTRWNLYVATSYNADGEAPTFTTQQSNPREDPVQVGCIWQRGGGSPRNCRNLLDFIDVTHDINGRFAVAFTDGCSARRGCLADSDSANGQSLDQEVAVAVMDRGEGLFLERGILPSLGLVPDRPIPHTADQP